MKRILRIIPFVVMFFAVAAWAEMQGVPHVVTDPSQAFITGSIVVKGEATADRSLPVGQRRLMALRGAKVVAFREVAEIVDGVAVSGETTVVNMSAQSDSIRTTVQGLVKGAQVIKEAYDPLSETATVYLQVPMTGPNGIFAALMPQVIPMVPQQMAPVYQPPVQMAPPPMEVKKFDGLIIDVREQRFKPALINRVLTLNGEVIYDPARVAQNILVERGAAEYTNDVGKAKALLGERGAGNPLVVKAGGVVKATDVQVSADDASSIFSSNQTNNFLEGAKVVFVLR